MGHLLLLLGPVIGATVLVVVGIQAVRGVDLAPIDDAAVAIYSADVIVRIRRTRSGWWGRVVNGGGWLRLEVRGDVVTIRSPGWPRLIASLFSLDHTLAAADLRVGSTNIVRPTRLSTGTDEHVFVAGTSRRGRYIELALQPRDQDMDRLRDALLRAGARPDDDD